MILGVAARQPQADRAIHFRIHGGDRFSASVFGEGRCAMVMEVLGR
jgi:hypothetical protein